ncbi:MAG: hypothetical protein EOP09_00720 [Proteobacteria bacterium]|nr:MAG: hypothetical protein EOP09_00720 [Pseudomonadota bacterium]
MANQNFNLPNMITLSSAAVASFGCLSVFFFAQQGGIYIGMIGVVVSLILDRIDGPIARKLGLSSPMGAQLDSLADLLAFGVTPGLLMAVTMRAHDLPIPWIMASAVFYTSCALWRLARFHDDGLVESRLGPAFVGIPSPVAGTAVVVTIATVEIFHLPAFTLLLSLTGLAYLMISPLKYPEYRIGAWPWALLAPMVAAYSIWRLIVMSSL